MKFISEALRSLSVRFERRPIGDVDALIEFVRTRASYVAQTSLYGYLKARMGTQYPRYFADEVFSSSIRIAAARLFVSCLGDLTVYSAAVVGQDRRLSGADLTALAHHCFETGVERHLSDFPAVNSAEAIADFALRSAEVHWASAADSSTAFAKSGADIVRFAPVVDEFKALDREIVANSVSFRWRDVREQLRRRIDPQAISGDWLARCAEIPAPRSKAP
jgi:hypothetical protein